MKHKTRIIYLFTFFIISIAGCKQGLNPSQARLFVVQEISLENGYSLFWFKDQRQITHDGLSYFQFAKDKCEITTESANAYCNETVQIEKVGNDTVSVLAYSDIVTIKSNELFYLKYVSYLPDLYSINKRPDKNKQYFLDSLCKGKNSFH